MTVTVTPVNDAPSPPADRSRPPGHPPSQATSPPPPMSTAMRSPMPPAPPHRPWHGRRHTATAASPTRPPPLQRIRQLHLHVSDAPRRLERTMTVTVNARERCQTNTSSGSFRQTAETPPSQQPTPPPPIDGNALTYARPLYRTGPWHVVVNSDGSITTPHRLTFTDPTASPRRLRRTNRDCHERTM